MICLINTPLDRYQDLTSSSYPKEIDDGFKSRLKSSGTSDYIRCIHNFEQLFLHITIFINRASITEQSIKFPSPRCKSIVITQKRKWILVSKIVFDNLSSNLNLCIRIKYFPRLNRWYSSSLFFILLFSQFYNINLLHFLLFSIKIKYIYIIISTILINFYIIIHIKILNRTTRKYEKYPRILN